MSEDQIYDITVIGGGPTGLFALFYAGMRQMSAKVIDSLEELGGQLIALYPEKYIYDMPGYAKVKAKDLVREMVEQGLQHGATPVLGNKVTSLAPAPDGTWVLGTENGDTHLSRTVLITAGPGGFTPKKLPLQGTEQWENRGLAYFVKDLSRFAGRRVLIVGGGDSALDWALHLHPIAERVTLIHRRDRFRGHESSVEELHASPVDVKLFWEVAEIHGDGCVQAATIFENRTQERTTIEVDDLLLCLGFGADLGPIRTWGLEMEGTSIKVNDVMETNLPGVYAAGDVTTHRGKLKLIATGVGEAAIAVNYAKTVVDPTARAFPGHSTDVMAPK